MTLRQLVNESLDTNAINANIETLNNTMSTMDKTGEQYKNLLAVQAYLKSQLADANKQNAQNNKPEEVKNNNISTTAQINKTTNVAQLNKNTSTAQPIK